MAEPGNLRGKRVLVTGAGCLGSRLVPRILADEPAELRVLDRSENRLIGLDGSVRTVLGDVTDPERVRAAAEGIDVVIHTAAVLDGAPEEYYHVNVTGTRVVAEASAGSGAERFVHVSSNAVYGFASGDVTEDMGPNPTKQAYSRSKAMGEGVVREVAAAGEMPFVIIRPAAIFGPGAEYFTAAYMRRAMKRPIVFVGRGNGEVAVIFVDDVAEMAAVVATHPGATGEAFNCAIDPPPTHREYLHAYGRLIGNTSYLGIPMPLAWTSSWAVVPFAKRETYARQLPQNLLQISRYVRYRMEKASDLLDWEPSYDLAAGIDASIPWLQERGILDHRLH